MKAYLKKYAQYKETNSNDDADFVPVPFGCRSSTQPGWYYVCIDDDGSAHAARSDLLCPRHSWRAARNSSMGSSSGQKSPNKTLGSWMGPFPCWAINSSTVALG